MPLNIGKAVRMERLFSRSRHRGVLVTLDHGVTMGPIPGLVSVRGAVEEAALGGADSVLMHKGLVPLGYREGGPDLGLFVHLSGSTDIGPDPEWKTLVCTVEEAVRLGADGVSVQVNLGGDGDLAMLADLGRVGKEASDWGMPLLAMMYARGHKVENPYSSKVVAHAARVAFELGADIVKVSYTGSPESFAKVVSGCSIPVLVAGGPRASSNRDFFTMIHGALQAGGTGVSVGRNVFQHTQPSKMVAALAGLVHHGWSVQKALAEIGED